jgi:hypothetical protein
MIKLQYAETAHLDFTRAPLARVHAYHVFQANTTMHWLRAHAKNVQRTRLLIQPNKNHVLVAQQVRHRPLAVLLAIHVLQGKQAQRAIHASQVNFVLDLISKLQFAVTAQRDTTKKARLKRPVFRAFQELIPISWD